jgi:CubicO group peptidase (beta-lactamase class C family)
MIRNGLKVFAAFSIALLSIFLFYGNADELTDKVDKIFSKWDSTESPGVALAIIKDGKILYKRGYGAANLEYNIPITSKTVFMIGSTTKQFTAMCIALLAEQGKLSLDDNIRKYLPEMPEYSSPIAIRNLIHHTSGVRDSDIVLWLSGKRYGAFTTDEQLLELLSHQKELNFKPGEEHLYSNAGYFLLSQIVKRASGQSMRNFAEENIFKPLGMSNTKFVDDHTMIVKNRATGYSLRENSEYKISISNADYVGDDGIFTTVEDLFLWDQNFYNNKLGKGGQGLINQILTPGVLNNGKKLDYAFGLVVTQHKGLKLIEHGGAWMGYRAQMIRFPEQKFSVICLANFSNINPSELCFKVADIYLANNFIREIEPKKPAAQPKPVILTEKQLKDKVGDYYDPESGQLAKFSIENKKLTLHSMRYNVVLSPISETTFVSLDAPVEISIDFLEKEKEIRAKIGRGEPLILKSIERIPLNPAQLNEYTGIYYSDEFEVIYNITIQNNMLLIKIQHGDFTIPLELVIKDSFLGPMQTFFNFFRDEQNKIKGFSVKAGRVRNIKFIKEIALK